KHPAEQLLQVAADFGDAFGALHRAPAAKSNIPKSRASALTSARGDMASGGFPSPPRASLACSSFVSLSSSDSRKRATVGVMGALTAQPPASPLAWGRTY